MTRPAVKVFDVAEGSRQGGFYRIEISFRGKIIEVIERPTMRQALDAFAAAGYQDPSRGGANCTPEARS